MELTGSRRRQDYLRQLGIGEDKQARFARKPWTTPSEEPLDDDSTLGNSWHLGHGSIADDNLSGACAFHVDKLNGQDDFRINFLRKLAYSKVWVPRVQRRQPL